MAAPVKIYRREPCAAHVNWPDDLPPVLQRVYARRQVSDASALDVRLARLHSYHALKGIDAAASLLAQAVMDAWHILVVGDFDADGATATTLAVHALRRMGAAKVSFIVPDRFVHGYGLTPEIVTLAQAQNPDLIITVDNGIASLDGVAAAKEQGIRVLVTDHHLPGAQLPKADAIINPNQTGCKFASRNLAGVGVIFYVISALRARLREQGWFKDRSAPALVDYLDLVALGTVADVVPLDHNNRVLVAQGLQRIRNGYGRPGIRALAQVAGRDCAQLVATDIGFGLAPRLNAAGRMQDMAIGIECLLAEDESTALRLALELDALNQQRRERQQEMQDDALAGLAAVEAELADTLPAGLCLHQPDWHEGIVGLVAGRVREKHFRPVIAFANTGADGAYMKGSARSIPGVHIRDVLADIASAEPGLIEKFGGHAMAAGLSLYAQSYPRFSAAFAQAIEARVRPEQLQNIVATDGELHAQEFTLENAIALRAGGPWGQGFEAPEFDGWFTVLEQRLVGERHMKLRLQPCESPQVISAIAFNHEQALPPTVRLVYRLDVNEYRGQRSAQLIVSHVCEPA